MMQSRLKSRLSIKNKRKENIHPDLPSIGGVKVPECLKSLVTDPLLPAGLPRRRFFAWTFG